MNLGVYESELSITRELLDNKLLECSEKLNKNPNDYQTLTELITISIYSGLNESALEFIDPIILFGVKGNAKFIDLIALSFEKKSPKYFF